MRGRLRWYGALLSPSIRHERWRCDARPEDEIKKAAAATGRNKEGHCRCRSFPRGHFKPSRGRRHGVSTIGRRCPPNACNTRSPDHGPPSDIPFLLRTASKSSRTHFAVNTALSGPYPPLTLWSLVYIDTYSLPFPFPCGRSVFHSVPQASYQRTFSSFLRPSNIVQRTSNGRMGIYCFLAAASSSARFTIFCVRPLEGSSVHVGIGKDVLPSHMFLSKHLSRGQ